jgi:hypothetical protein
MTPAERLLLLQRKHKELTTRLSRLEQHLSDPNSNVTDEEVKMEAWDVRNQLTTNARAQRALQNRGIQ